jgi:hypothetical protein
MQLGLVLAPDNIGKLLIQAIIRMLGSTAMQLDFVTKR